MIRMINEYIQKVKPTDKFLGLAFINNCLKVAYASYVDIATYDENGNLVIERRSAYDKVQAGALC